MIGAGGLSIMGRAKRRSPERALHMTVEAFLRAAWPKVLPYSHFPAGEARDERTAAKLKAMGLKPGWPDFLFILPTGHVAFIELKAGKGTLTEHQKAFRDRVKGFGCCYAECRSLTEVEAFLEGLIGPFGYRLAAHT